MKKLFLIVFTVLPFICFGQYYGLMNKPLAGVSYSDEYQALLDYASGQGYATPNETQAMWGDSLCNCLVNGGYWSGADVILIFREAPDEDWAGINWKTATDMAMTENGTITWNINTGFSTNGSSYFDMNWNVTDDATNYTQNDNEFSIWVNNGTFLSSTDYLGGMRGGTVWSSIGVRSFTWDRVYAAAMGSGEVNTATSEPADLTDDLIAAYRTSSTVQRVSVNGVEDLFVSNTSAADEGYNFFLFAQNRLGAASGHASSGTQIHFVYIGASIGDDTGLYNCVNTFFTNQ